jgi:hypothetical protein
MTFFPLLLMFWGLINNQNIAIGSFETSDISRHALAKNLTKLLGKYDLRKINHCLC